MKLINYKFTTIILFIIINQTMTTAQTFDSLWANVETKHAQLLPKSVNKTLDKIEAKAIKEKQPIQQLSAALFRLKVIDTETYEDDELKIMINYAENYIEKLADPEKAIMHAAVADLYTNYLSDNYFQIRTNEPIVGDIKQNDIEYWDVETFIKKIDTHYEKALKASEILKQTDAKPYQLPICICYEHINLGELTLQQLNNDKTQSIFDFEAEPTLYNLIENKYIQNNQIEERFAQVETTWKSSDWWLDYEQFINLEIPTQNDPFFNTLRAFQRLQKFNKEKNYHKALILNEIRQLQYLHKQLGEKKTFAQYLNGLQHLMTTHAGSEFESDIMAEIAQVLFLQKKAFPTDSNYSTNYAKTLQLCETVIKQYPKTKASKTCNNLIDNILQKQLSFTLQKVQLPNQAIPIALTYRNITNPHYRIYKIKTNENDIPFRITNDEIIDLIKTKPLIKGDFKIPEEIDFEKHTTILALPKLSTGLYFIILSNDEIPSKNTENHASLSEYAYNFFQVSNLSYICNENPEGIRIQVLNRETGKPIEKATVTLNQTKYHNGIQINKIITKLTTDNKGFVEYNENTDEYIINISYEKDKLLSNNAIYIYKPPKDKWETYTKFFTDRAIYRPGQTVHFKGILLSKNQQKKQYKLETDTKIKVYFKDSNYQDIKTQEFTTDNFGSFHGTFTIPTGLMSGDYCLNTSNGSIFIKVEEYKRPTFEIEFDEITEVYKLNQNIKIEGTVKALAGFGLDNVNIKYRVVSRQTYPYLPWFWRLNAEYNEQQITHGNGKTGKNGRFEIEFKLHADANPNNNLPPIYQFEISIEATSANGETHENYYTLIASNLDAIITTNVENTINIENINKYKIETKNLNYEPTEKQIVRRFYRIKNRQRFAATLLHDNDNIDNKFERDLDYYDDDDDDDDDELRDIDRKLLSDNELDTLFPHFDYYGDFNSKSAQQLVYEDTITVNGEANLFPDGQSAIKNFIPGKYIVELVSQNDVTNSNTATFTIFDPNNQQIPYHEMCWWHIDKQNAQHGDTVTFRVGSAAQNVQVFVNVLHEKTIRYSLDKELDNNTLTIKYIVRDEDRGELSFQAYFVKYNTQNIVQQNVEIPFNNLKLNIKLKHTPTNLLPGENKKIELQITDYKQLASIANLTVGMYDASLDAFATNNWQLDLLPTTHVTPKPRADIGFGHHTASNQQYYYLETVLFKCVLLSDGYLVPMDWYIAENGPDYCESSARSYSLASDAIKTKENTKNDDVQISDTKKDKKENKQPAIRKKFDETAFFYPNLTTNANGNATFSFTMPDAITRWNLLMLAYDQQLRVGTLRKSINTRKPLMIMADMPRFCYQNDTIYIAATIVNTSENNCAPLARLEVFDALNHKTVNVLQSAQDQQLDTIMPGQNIAATWKIAFAPNMRLLALRFSALTNDYSDAEERLLPILSNEIFLTQTFPIAVEADTCKTLTFNELGEQKNERNDGLTLNFSANPTWYAIQALPYLAQNDNDHADAVFYRLYANTLAQFIAQKTPNLQNIIKSWQQESPDALTSQLQKDENLKAVLLQATPWVLEAKNESEQKARIANLFDINTMEHNLDKNLKLIQSQQTKNGGWPWFPNMPESVYITQYILNGFGKLKSMGVLETLNAENQTIINNICDEAIAFLQKEIIKIYKEIKKEKQTQYLTNHYTVDIFYALSYFNLPINSKDKEAEKYFMSTFAKQWPDFDVSTQAKIALIMYRAKNEKVAELIIKSLGERAQLSETTGMYWARRSNAYYFTPHVSDHAQVMEAFAEIAPNPQEISMMRNWLLTHKRTNMWVNAGATVDAIYALLMRGDNWLANDKSVDLRIGNQHISTSTGQAGTGFIQKHWDAADITPEMAQIDIKNNTAHLVWGGLFRQYFVPIDEVKASNNQLRIERQLFAERVNQSGIYLVPIDEAELKVGDKVTIRLTFECEQNLNFVYLKDLHAACLEPTEQLTHANYSDGMFYYRSTKDTHTSYYFYHMPKGKHQVSHTMYVTKRGDFSNGYALIQCLYAPELNAYSKGRRIQVK